jgi:GWxTD domain-containing protein
MSGPRVLRAGIPILFFLLMALPVQAKKTLEMPADFGGTAWASANWTQAVGYLKYIAEKKVQEKLLTVPESSRAAAWDEVWKEIDPVKTLAPEQYRDAYFARVRFANDNFSTNLQYGWLTDRGETYVRLGAPKDIERFTMRARGRDIEVWQYWVPHEVDLYFVDQTGVGDMYLLNPQDMIAEAYIYGRP